MIALVHVSDADVIPISVFCPFFPRKRGVKCCWGALHAATPMSCLGQNVVWGTAQGLPGTRGAEQLGGWAALMFLSPGAALAPAQAHSRNLCCLQQRQAEKIWKLH